MRNADEREGFFIIAALPLVMARADDLSTAGKLNGIGDMA
jgi:hypothetical protein